MARRDEPKFDELQRLLRRLEYMEVDKTSETPQQIAKAPAPDAPKGKAPGYVGALRGAPTIKDEDGDPGDYAEPDPDAWHERVVASVLSGGMSGRLFTEVREKRGLAYSVYSFAAGYSDAGIVGLYAGCGPKRAPQVAELMLSEFRRIAVDGITDDELARARGQLGGASALALEDSDTRMSRLGRSELTFGEFSDLDETLRRLAGVTTSAVRDLAAELVERPLSIAAVGPVDPAALGGLDLESAA